MTKERIAICFVISLFFLSMGTASSAEITVNNSTGSVADFTSIQAAVDAAKDGDTIIVYSGIYIENIDVNKELTIISQSGNPEDTVVQPLDKYTYGFNVTANNVTISGFRLVGYDENGIHLYGVQHNNISNNELSGCKIDLISSENNTVSNNSVSTSMVAHLYNSNNNLLINNIFSGFETGFSMSDSDNNILKGNSIAGCDQGLIIIGSSNNTFDNNSIHGYWEGIYFYPPSNNNTLVNNYISAYEGSIAIYSSYNNLIYNNYFDTSAIFNPGDDGNNSWNITKTPGTGNNSWNITKTPGTNIVGGPFLGGNYWSNYAGTDTDGDGLGDTLLSYWVDYLPLVKPAEPPAPAAEYITVNNGAGEGADFTSIQAAVDAAKNGDTIIVYSGIYIENVDVNKELTIISQSGNPEDTVVQAASSSDHVFHVTADGVKISGFNITGARDTYYAGICLGGVGYCLIENNTASENFYGICLESSSSNTLENTTVSHSNTLENNTANSNNGHGIYLYYSGGNVLNNNTANLNSESGIYLEASSSNTLSNNTASNNTENGITLVYGGVWEEFGDVLGSTGNILINNEANSNSESGIYLYSDGNTLNNNTVSNNYYGMRLTNFEDYFDSYTGDNTLYNNTVSNNYYGMRLEDFSNNFIYNNYFNNTNNTYFEGTNTGNIWNTTKTPGTNIVGGPFLGGNYWSDYAGDDTDGDGLGDTLLPYNSEGQIANGGDYLPLVAPDDVKYNPYDTNQDCEISIDELSAAIDDFYSGVLEIEDISEIIDYYYLGGEGYC